MDGSRPLADVKTLNLLFRNRTLRQICPIGGWHDARERGPFRYWKRRYFGVGLDGVADYSDGHASGKRQGESSS